MSVTCLCCMLLCWTGSGGSLANTRRASVKAHSAGTRERGRYYLVAQGSSGQFVHAPVSEKEREAKVLTEKVEKESWERQRHCDRQWTPITHSFIFEDICFQTCPDWQTNWLTDTLPCSYESYLFSYALLDMEFARYQLGAAFLGRERELMWLSSELAASLHV